MRWLSRWRDRNRLACILLSKEVYSMSSKFNVRSSRWIALGVLFIISLLVSAVYGQDAPVTTRDSAPDGSQYELAQFASALTRPVFISGAGDGSGRLFIVGQFGKIYLMVNGALQDTPFLDVSSLVSTDASERG